MNRVKIDPPREVLFAHDVPVRITDHNYGNHLGHDAMVTILHEARARFFRHFRFEEWDVDGHATMVVDLAVSYRAEARFGDVLRIEIGAGDVGSRSCELIYRVTGRDDGAEIALAKTGIVLVDTESRQMVRLPEGLLAALRGQGSPPR